MARIILVLCLLASFVANAQYPPGYTGVNQRYDWFLGKFRGLHLPIRGADDTSFLATQWQGAGAVVVDTVNNKFYFWSGGKWNEAGGSDGGIHSANADYGLIQVNDSTLRADTLAMATILQTQHRIDSLAALGANDINATDSNFVNSSKKILWRNWVNVKDHGAVMDGVTDDATALQAAIDAAGVGGTVFIPPTGTMLISTQVSLKYQQTLMGVGNNSKVYVTANIKAIVLDSSTVVKDIWFNGPGKATGGTNNSALFISNSVDFQILNCLFTNFGGDNNGVAGGAISGAQIVAGYSVGGVIMGCTFDNNDIAIDLGNRAEYILIEGNRFNANNYGTYIQAGNTRIANNNFQDNLRALYVTTGSNPYKLQVIGNSFNHNTLSLDLNGITIDVGAEFIGNHYIAKSAIKLTNCSGVLFTAERIDNNDSIHLDNTDHITMHNCYLGSDLTGIVDVPINKYNGADDIVRVGIVRKAVGTPIRSYDDVYNDTMYIRNVLHLPNVAIGGSEDTLILAVDPVTKETVYRNASSIGGGGGGSTSPAGSDTEVQFNNAGAFGADASFKWNSTGNYLDIWNGGISLIYGADAAGTGRTNNTNKLGLITVPHYANAEEPVATIGASISNGSNVVQIGGGQSSVNAVTEIRSYIGATATTTTGTEKTRLTASGLYIGTGASAAAKLHIEAGTTALAPIGLTTGTFITTPLAGRVEYVTPQLTFTNGTLIRQDIPLIQQSRVSTQFDATTTTLANVTGLTASVAASATYRFEATLYVDANITGGSKIAIGGTATATSIIYQTQMLSSSTDVYTINERETAMGASAEEAGTTEGFVKITGTITVNAAGTLTVQYAQSAANETSSVVVGSIFVVTQML